MKYAHSLEDAPVEQWQPLEAHLKNVAALSESFAAAFHAEAAGKLLGFVHDLGKSRRSFADYLLRCNGLSDENYDSSDHTHSGAGACYLKGAVRNFGHFLAYCVAGHHAGLPDGSSASGAASLESRLDKESAVLAEDDVRQWLKENASILAQLTSALPSQWLLTKADMALWIRMLFSCLVDADFLDTENFMTPGRSGLRGQYPELAELSARFFACLNRKQQSSPATAVNRVRAEIRNQCELMAAAPPGIFSLTVPTGGGKTLSGMAFAFKHALKYHKRRIIYVIPYTSIIEQTSAVLRDFLDEDNVVEHHSNFDPERATLRANLAAENWDAPVVVTTSVQFFESLFACRPSRCRKLHNIADSIVILDEVQLLPPHLLHPCKEVIRQLSKNYGTTFVMSTATQPYFPDLEITEIIPENMKLFERLKRVDIAIPPQPFPRQNWDEVASELLKYRQVLCIVNTREDCRRLYEKMPDGTIPLSALMCGSHRSEVIAEIKQRLANGSALRVVATNLVEAGVDIDFPVVFRAYTGLPSIMQSAGRCNREGKLDSRGKVFVFMPPDVSPVGDLRKAEETLTELLGGPEKVSPDDPASYPRFFENFYLKINDCGTGFDELLVKKVTDGIIQFREAAEKFRMIDDSRSRPLIVRYGENDVLIGQLREHGPSRELMRKLQRSTVNIASDIMTEFLRRHWAEEVHPGVFVQLHPDLYDASFGVNTRINGLELKDLIY